MSDFIARYMFNFYFRAIFSCFLYSFSVLNFRERILTLWMTIGSSLHSVLFLRYILHIPIWTIQLVTLMANVYNKEILK